MPERLAMSKNFIVLPAAGRGAFYFVKKAKEKPTPRLFEPEALGVGDMVATLDYVNGSYIMKLVGFDTERVPYKTKEEAETVISAHIALLS
jgi:hypothetical protein